MINHVAVHVLQVGQDVYYNLAAVPQQSATMNWTINVTDVSVY